MLRLARGGRADRASQMALEHLRTGGKRLRARLALAAAEALDGERSRTVAWAAAVELLHNASLVHDDIQDGDTLRRGQPTTWSRYGVAQAINAGDLLLMLPYEAVGEVPATDTVRFRLVSILAERASLTVRGQTQELRMLRDRNFSPADYLEVVRRKTGELLALPVEGAALIAGRDARSARSLGEEFIDLGTLFQLQDDALDLYGDKGRQPGVDLYAGKVSALVVAHLSLFPEEEGWLLELLRRPAEETTGAEVAEARRRFAVPGGALDHTIANIREISIRTAESEVLKREPALHEVALQLAERAVMPIQHLMQRRAVA
jgi:geranylgeranyl pyrophosphate synthase